VGTNERPFLVHKKTICDAVEPFGKMFRGGFAEASSHTATLPEDDPEAFGLLVEWVYKDQLPQFGDDTVRRDCILRLKLYILAEKYGLIPLMDDSMDFIRLCFRTGRCRMTLKWCDYAYENTPEKSPLRSFISSYFVYQFFHRRDEDLWSTSEFSAVAANSCDLVQDVFQLMRGKFVPPITGYPWEEFDPCKGTCCRYHYHSAVQDDDKCPYNADSRPEYKSSNALKILTYFREGQNGSVPATGQAYKVNEHLERWGLDEWEAYNAAKELIHLGILDHCITSRNSFVLPERTDLSDRY